MCAFDPNPHYFNNNNSLGFLKKFRYIQKYQQIIWFTITDSTLFYTMIKRTYCKLKHFSNPLKPKLYIRMKRRQKDSLVCLAFFRKRNQTLQDKKSNFILLMCYVQKNVFSLRLQNFCSIILNMIQQFKDLYCKKNSFQRVENIAWVWN